MRTALPSKLEKIEKTMVTKPKTAEISPTRTAAAFLDFLRFSISSSSISSCYFSAAIASSSLANSDSKSRSGFASAVASGTNTDSSDF